MIIFVLIMTLLALDLKAESFDLGEPATTIQCKWIAKHEGGLRFQRMNGQLDSIDADQMKWVSNIKGTVLEKTPLIDVVEHRMHCSGGKCEPTRTVVHELWPDNSRRDSGSVSSGDSVDTPENQRTQAKRISNPSDRLPKPLTK